MRHVLLVLALLLPTPVLSVAAQPVAATPPPSEAETVTTAELEQLIRVLEDEAARNRLIEQLRGALADGAGDATAAPPPTLARHLAEYSREAADSVLDLMNGAMTLAAAIGRLFTTDVTRIGTVAINVIIVAAVTFAAFVVARFAGGFVVASLARGAEHARLLRRVGLAAAYLAVEAAVVLAAWAVGWITAVQLDAAQGVGINRALFLNAFVMTELAKVVLRTLFAPRHPTLRLIPAGDTTAAYWSFWLSRLVSLVGYTFLFVAPILAINVSRTSSEAVQVAVMLAALTVACIIVLQNRDQVKSALTARANACDSDVPRRVLGGFAGIWHVVAITYLIAVFVLWLIDRERALPFAMIATIQSLVAIVVGTALLAFITRLASGGMNLPEDLKQKLPLLEYRLNAFVPNVLRVVHVLVMLAVAVVIAQVWMIVDVIGWLSSELGQQVVASLLSSAIILAIGGLIYLAVSSWVEYRLNPNIGRVPTARERTLLDLFHNAVTVVLVVLVVMLVLAELGLDIGPLLAGAGVVGLAIGFGAQKLVQDVITGVFIQFENAMNEGDVVTAGGVTGVVEKLTIRSVSMRSLDGVYHVIPFSSVDAVSNFMKHFGYHVAAIRVAFRERVPDAKQAMFDAFERLRQTEHGDNIIDDLEMHGVTEFADSAVVVRARIKTLPGAQWGVGRAYNEILKEVFDERGIEIPVPHIAVYMGDTSSGKVAPQHAGPFAGITVEASSTGAGEKPRTGRKYRGRKPQQDGPAEDSGFGDDEPDAVDRP